MTNQQWSEFKHTVSEYVFEPAVSSGTFLRTGDRNAAERLPGQWMGKILTPEDFAAGLQSATLADPIKWLREDTLEELRRIRSELLSYADGPVVEQEYLTRRQISSDFATYKPLAVLQQRIESECSRLNCDEFPPNVAEWVYADIQLLTFADQILDRLEFESLELVRSMYSAHCIPVGWIESDREHPDFPAKTMIGLAPS